MNSIDHSLEALLTFSSTLPCNASMIVSELLGGKVDSVETLRQGLMTFKYLVRAESGQQVIVRFYPPRRTSVVNQEPDLLLRCRYAGIPVPSVISDSRTGPPAELSYVVYHMVEGTTLLEHLAVCNAEQRSLLASNLAKHLFDLRTLDFDGCGELATSREALDPTWKIFVERSLRKGFEAVQKHSFLDKTMTEKVQRVVDRGFPNREKLTNRLVWGDINFENIIVDSSSGLAGLIDFESCLSGDPLATLGYCFAAHGTETFFSTLLNAWPEPVDTEEMKLVLFYAILRALRLACYAHLPLPTGYVRDPLTHIFPGIILALEQLSDSY